ncbi:sorbitol dehydrogenase-like [Topomyia yanbarensis]|uniref:sorbitol dehydrogenase-like n=1 Tax=Topomyia yanbarensis TaxID=2498891 RepID=UPI00273B1B53|nr:sorbitol dehydrogenase-like [Topomyia yanbarensis]
MAKKVNVGAVIHGVEDMRMEQVPMPTPRDNEVLLEMDCVGICGSDVHVLTHGGFGEYKLRQPMVIGHESSGVVIGTGKSVKRLKVGDRVAVEPAIGCKVCKLCKAGRYNLCPDGIYSATPPIHGTLQNFYTHVEDCCFKLPPNVTMEEGALLEPLAVGVHSCRIAGIQLGSNVLILGAGPIGMVTVLVAKAMGAAKICVLDLVQSKLDVAKEIGADVTLQIKKGDKEEDLVKKIHQLLGVAPDISIECTGAEPCVRLGILATEIGGVLTLVGIGSTNMNLPITIALVREVEIRSGFRYANAYPAALTMVANGTIDATKLISHHFDLKDSVEAFKTSRYGLDGAIKVMIHCQPRNKNNPGKKM